MNKKLLIIKITLWWGIVADLFETIRMIFPQLFIKTTGATLSLNDGIRFTLLYGAPVMLGWIIILFWASRKPIDRRGVFLCLMPVIISYFIVEIMSVNLGRLSLNQTIPTFILQSVLLSLTIISYIFAREMSKKR
ncbi:hypothetical protein [Haliovirga abyssi]|uniref:Uncharacterized protein n=1 Tax=Haliovirga abyssi TaxID=2996794 RepID=A0AAU9D7C6_9FUSO|nr:hypothetical protein [Haliovirga abyssi]BDU49476.1 hypothetical protein HLVA_00450 [Haliovirga abyssi]